MENSNKKHKRMFWVYTILGGLFAIGATFCTIMAVYHDRKIVKEPDAQGHDKHRVYNVKGDFIQGNKTESNINSKNANSSPEPNPLKDKKLKQKTPQTIINNNGNYVNGDNYGNVQQTTNNYAPQPRHLNDQTKNDLNSIPKDYHIIIWYGFTDESAIYANEIYAYLFEDLNFSNIEAKQQAWTQTWDVAGEKRQAESFNLKFQHEINNVIILVQKR